jgi:hypothetical protein
MTPHLTNHRLRANLKKTLSLIALLLSESQNPHGKTLLTLPPLPCSAHLLTPFQSFATAFTHYCSLARTLS